MIQDVTLRGKIEIGVIRQIDHGVFVRRGPILNPQIALHQGVPNHSRHVARITRLAIFALITQFHTILDRLCLPHHVVEAVRSTVKRVLSVIQRQGVLLAIQRKAAVRDAIRIAANDRPEERNGSRVEIGYVSIEIVETKHHVRRLAVAVWGFEGNYNSTVRRDSSFVGAVAQRKNFYRSSIRHLSKWLACHRRLSLRAHGKQP